MGRKCTVFFLSIMLILGFLIGHAAAGEEKFKLRMQSYFPPTTIQGDKQFARNVEKMSNGRIKITVFAGGELVPTPDILKAVKTGTIDIGHGIDVFFSEFGLAGVGAAFPMSWLNAQEAEIIFAMGLSDLLAAEYEKSGVKFLSQGWGAPIYLISNVPVSSTDDLKKIKINAYGETAMMLQKLGVGVVDMPPEDLYLGLTTGVVDGVIYGCGFEYYLMKLHEAAGYLNITPFFDPATDVFIVNKKLWNKLPEDLQAILNSAVQQARWDYYKWVLSEEYKTREKYFKGKLTSFSSEDLKKITRASVEVWDEMAARSPEVKKAIDIVKKFARWQGRIE